MLRWGASGVVGEDPQRWAMLGLWGRNFAAGEGAGAGYLAIVGALGVDAVGHHLRMA